MNHEGALRLWKNVGKLSLHPQRKEIMKDKVLFIDPERVYVSNACLIDIGEGTIIAPDVFLLGRITIGKDCLIGPGQVLHNVVTEDRVQIGARPNIQDSDLEEGSRVGRLAEVVRSNIGPATSIQHFSYVGDAMIGSGVNIGAGVVIANYDGSIKCLARVRDDVFIGSNSTLVSPVQIGQESFIGAGAIIRKDVESNSVVVGVDRVLPLRESHKDGKNWKVTRIEILEELI